MFTGLESPSHLIIVLAIVLLLFGAKRVPELARGLGAGIKEFREGISTGDSTQAEAPESEQAPGAEAPGRTRVAAGDETVRSHDGQRGL